MKQTHKIIGAVILTGVLLLSAGCPGNRGVSAYRTAAERGDAEAQYYLGACYLLGDGIPEDKAEAVKWLHKSAEQGHVKAQYQLGMSYFFGDGVPEDQAEGVKWFHKAADQGYDKAIEALRRIEDK